MKLLITGICGFAGSAIAVELQRLIRGVEIIGLDNLSRPGSEQNRRELQRCGIKFIHGDVRQASDLENLPKVDWVVDAAANPSVLAGLSGPASSRQVVEHNLGGTFQLLEYCKRHRAGFVLLSTSRVYSAERLRAVPLEVKNDAFTLELEKATASGLSAWGINEEFSTQTPGSLYGAAKLASESIALEYGAAFDFPVRINRCGVLAGAGQFGKPDQGIFSFWIHSWRARRPLKYIGFGGHGNQVRDCLHPRDLAALLYLQMLASDRICGPMNVSGGNSNAVSLAQLSRWCAVRFGEHEVGSEPQDRVADVPWLVLDHARTERAWGWTPFTRLESIFEEIATHAEEHKDWLDLSNGG